MTQAFSRDILKTVVAQISQTIGWHAIQTTPLELMVDFLHRNLEEICKVTHRYSEQFGQTMPNLDHLGLAFQDLGIDLQDLGDYVRNVESVPCSHDVPQYPLVRETHLNFLKPGSHEVVHRPVHVHEHLPPMHPDLEDPGKQTPLLTDMPSTPSDGTSSNVGVFKRPGDPLESPALKRTRMMMEEEGRPLREISSVIMTTSGFLSPAREGKLPESRAPLIPSETGGNLSPTPSSYPTVPPEVKSEKKVKKTTNKKTPLGTKKLDKENSKKEKLKESGKVEKTKVKKLASMKEISKLKALKSGAKKVPPIASEGNPKDFANFLQNLFQSSTNQSKSKSGEPSWAGAGPSTSKELSPVEKTREGSILEGKLSAEPDKQKLNIFKKISKVKEEKTDAPRDSRESSVGLVSEEFGEKSWPVSTVSTVTILDSDKEEDDEIYISDNLSPPGTPLTPRTPELPSKLGKKRKKDKSKSKSKLKSLAKKIKLEQMEVESLERPKTPEAPSIPLFAFSNHFPPAPGLIPPPLMHPLFPNLPFPKPIDPSTSMVHPAMPNLPLPPLNFMQPAETVVVATEDVTIIETETTTVVEKEKVVEKDKDKDKEKEKKSKELKKEDKKIKKKKLKKDKIKNKEKGEKKKDKEEKKNRDKEKSKEKKEKKKEREREEKPPEIPVPKITFKLGPDNSRPSTPEGQTRKIVIKPVVKKDEVVSVAEPPKRAVSPELARISALITRHPKQKNKAPVEALGSELFAPPSVAEISVKTEPKTKESKKATFAAASSKETVAFYHHASAGGPGPSNKSPRGPAGRGAKPGDDAGNKIWICPACKGPDDGSPMIGCDDCDAWYHWVCVGIQVPPDDKEDWYCRECIQRKQEAALDKKKKPRKKKDK